MHLCDVGKSCFFFLPLWLAEKGLHSLQLDPRA